MRWIGSFSPTGTLPTNDVLYLTSNYAFSKMYDCFVQPSSVLIAKQRNANVITVCNQNIPLAKATLVFPFPLSLSFCHSLCFPLQPESSLKCALFLLSQDITSLDRPLDGCQFVPHLPRTDTFRGASFIPSYHPLTLPWPFCCRTNERGESYALSSTRYSSLAPVCITFE